MSDEIDVVVVGAGNAGLSAALAASEAGARVRLLERAEPAERGGNTTFTGAAYRFSYDSPEQVRAVIRDLTDEEASDNFATPYRDSDFLQDLARVTSDRIDPDLAEVMVMGSREAVTWLADKGVRFIPLHGHGWRGMSMTVSGGGRGLVDALFKTVDRDENIEVTYGARATGLLISAGRVSGVRVVSHDLSEEIRARSVILASGGFQASAADRAKYLGPGWDMAKVRGTWCNTGDGLRMAIEAGAQTVGNWSGAHATAWDLNAPPFGDPAVGHGFQKHNFGFGIMVNADGKRFMDEGSDVPAYTYAKAGREILAQPGMFAWQIFDAKSVKYLREEYRIKQVTRVRADSVEELARKLTGVDPVRFLETLEEYNQAAGSVDTFDPDRKDGTSTKGLAIPKSNWALPLDTAPFEAYAVTCGITFTFGGIRIDTNARVLRQDRSVIEGLYSAGEMVGGLYHFNYPGGSGLTSGAVFGRRAGYHAAAAITAA